MNKSTQLHPAWVMWFTAQSWSILSRPEQPKTERSLHHWVLRHSRHVTLWFVTANVIHKQ